MHLKSALAAALLAGLAIGPAAAKSPLAPPRQCFWTHSVSGFRALNDRIVNIRVGVRDVYQFEMMGPCQDIDWNEHIAIVSRGSSQICSGLDAELISDTPIGPHRCAVSMVRKLTPAEVAAMPKKARP